MGLHRCRGVIRSEHTRRDTRRGQIKPIRSCYARTRTNRLFTEQTLLDTDVLRGPSELTAHTAWVEHRGPIKYLEMHCSTLQEVAGIIWSETLYVRFFQSNMHVLG